MNNDKTTSLHQAVCLNDIDLLKRLLAQGEPVDIRDHRGMTALHVAAATGQEAIITLLLQCGADLKITDNQGQTAMVHAVKGGHVDAVRLLTVYDLNVSPTSVAPQPSKPQTNTAPQPHNAYTPPGYITPVVQVPFWKTFGGRLIASLGAVVIGIVVLACIYSMFGTESGKWSSGASRVFAAIYVCGIAPLLREIWCD